MDSHPRLKQTYISQAKKQKDEKYTQRNVRWWCLWFVVLSKRTSCLRSLTNDSIWRIADKRKLVSVLQIRFRVSMDVLRGKQCNSILRHRFSTTQTTAKLGFWKLIFAIQIDWLCVWFPFNRDCIKGCFDGFLFWCEYDDHRVCLTVNTAGKNQFETK